MQMLSRTAGCVLMWGLCLACPQTLWAHAFHITLTEMEFNSDSGVYEVAMKVNAIDLEQLFRHLSDPGAKPLSPADNEDHTLVGKSLSKDFSAEQTRLFQDYLAQNFYLSRGLDDTEPVESERSRIKWIGVEAEGAALWVYFELQPPTGQGEIILTNKVFTTLNKGQSNTLVLISQAERVCFKTDATNFRAPLKGNK